MFKRYLGDISKINPSNKDYQMWRDLSTLKAGSSFDHMQNYLAQLGYSGHPRDAFRQLMQDISGNQGSTYDNAKSYYNTL